MAGAGVGGMTTAQRQNQWVQQLLDLENESRARRLPDWLNDIQENAKQTVMDYSVLDRKQEDWRYTSIDGLLNNRFLPVSARAATHKIPKDANFLLPDFNSIRLVFVNGQLDSRLSDLKALPKGVIVSDLQSALQSHSDEVSEYFGKVLAESGNLFTSLNSAMMNDGVFVHIGSAVKMEQPIEIVYLHHGGDDAIISQPRNLFVLKDAASATVVERFLGLDQGIYFQNILTELVLEENAQLKHYRIQDESLGAYHSSYLSLKQDANSRYYGTGLAFGGAWSRTEYHASFQHEQAECLLHGLYMVGERQLCDFHLDIRHDVPDCVSRERFKGILYGKGRAVFDGRILVNKQAQHSDAQLSNDNLMLTRLAEVDTKPQLEIYADDVKCSHGTTVGQIDPLQIFYLRSRGIDEISARKMLCQGFAEEIINSMDIAVLRDEAINNLNAALNGANQKEG